MGVNSTTSIPEQSTTPVAGQSSSSTPQQTSSANATSVPGETSTPSTVIGTVNTSPSSLQSNIATLTGPSGTPVTLTLPPGVLITGPTTVTTNGQTLTVGPTPSASSTPGASSASTSNVVTLTGADGNPVTLTLPPGSSITGPTTVTTNGQTLTVGPIPRVSSTPGTPSASTSNVVTLTGADGNPVTLTLPPGSSIAGQTTLTTDGETLTLAPIQSSLSSPPTSGSPSISGTTPAIIVDGTTIPIGSAFTTTTEADGSTIIIGPPGIVVGSVTIPIPTLPTTITTDGETLTFAGEVPISVPGVPPRVFVITPPPPGAPGSIPTGIPPQISPAPEVDIIFQGETYMLPWTGTVDLLQSDGSTVTLASSQIVSGTVTLPVPAVSFPTTLSLDGLTIIAQPGSVGTPSSGGLSGFLGLIKALVGLAGSATSIANTLGQISEQGVLWAAGSISDASFSTSVDGLLSTATSDLSSWVSTMNGVFQDFNGEVYELTEDGLRLVFPARTGAVEEFNILTALRKLTTNLVDIRSDVIPMIKDYWIQGTVFAAVLAAAEEALRNFAEFSWDNETPQPVSLSGTINATATATVSGNKNSTIPTLIPSATAIPYIFGTKSGTDPSVFQSYIKTLPDGGQGGIIQYPNVPWQSYVTRLTLEQAQEVAGSTPDVVYRIQLVDRLKAGTMRLLTLSRTSATPTNEPLEPMLSPMNIRLAFSQLTLPCGLRRT